MKKNYIIFDDYIKHIVIFCCSFTMDIVWLYFGYNKFGGLYESIFTTRMAR